MRVIKIAAPMAEHTIAGDATSSPTARGHARCARPPGRERGRSRLRSRSPRSAGPARPSRHIRRGAATPVMPSIGRARPALCSPSSASGITRAARRPGATRHRSRWSTGCGWRQPSRRWPGHVQSGAGPLEGTQVPGPGQGEGSDRLPHHRRLRRDGHPRPRHRRAGHALRADPARRRAARAPRKCWSWIEVGRPA